MKKVIALGYFDSIHLGHKYLLNIGKEEAIRCNADLCVATFGDDFLRAIGRESEQIFLLSERIELLKAEGIDDVIVFPDNNEFLSMTCYEFISYLENFNIESIVVGSDYRFGKNAKGDAYLLSKYFTSKGIKVIVVNLLKINENKISSGEIKKLLKDGQIEKANLLLGHSFTYIGNVKSGRKEGKKIGFPTLNIEIPKNKIKIKSGVYATKTIIGENIFLSVTNVGEHPTFNDMNFNVETYVMGDVGEIYGQKIYVMFISYIREIYTFKNKDELSKMIENDIKIAKGKMIND